MPTATALTGHTATITNFGPLTTTYSAPTSCSTATDHLYIGMTEEPGILWGYPSCPAVQTFGDCIPSGHAFDKLMTDVYAKILDHGFYHYYSPGLHCPSGWTTAAALVNNGGSFTEISGYLTQSYTNWLGRWEPGRAQPSDPGEVWKQALLPSETLKICCPSGFEGDNNGDCYSVLGPMSSYSFTEVCGYYAASEPTPTGTQTVHNSTITLWKTLDLTTVTRTLETGEYRDAVVATRVPVVALIHKEPDLELSGGEGSDEKSSAVERSKFQQTSLLCLVLFSTLFACLF